MATTQKITTNLWFNGNAEEAVNFYLVVFSNSKMGRRSYYTEEGQEYHKKEPGTLLTIEFWLNGQEFVALNAGNEFKFNEAISFIINCDNQNEIDYYWDKLGAGGQIQMCGWLKDKFGVSWQVVPNYLTDLLAEDSGSEPARKAMRAMFTMKKLDIKTLKDAANGR